MAWVIITNHHDEFLKVLRSRDMARKHSDKANVQISTGLPRPDLLAPCTLESQKLQQTVSID